MNLTLLYFRSHYFASPDPRYRRYHFLLIQFEPSSSVVLCVGRLVRAPEFEPSQEVGCALEVTTILRRALGPLLIWPRPRIRAQPFVSAVLAHSPDRRVLHPFVPNGNSPVTS